MNDYTKQTQEPEILDTKNDLDSMKFKKTSGLNLDNNVAGLLCYIPIAGVNVIASIVWLITENKLNSFLRFHALQSLVLSGAYFILGAIVWTSTVSLALIPFLRGFTIITNLAWFCICMLYLGTNIYMMISAYKHKAVHLPYAGTMAEQLLDRQTV